MRLHFLFDTFIDTNACNRRHGSLVLTALALAWLLPCCAGAEGVFKWVDGEGKVHYGDAAPNDRDAEPVRIPAPPPSGEKSPIGGSQHDLPERNDASETDKVSEQDRELASLKEEMRERRCRDAQHAMSVLEMERPVFHVDEQGNRVYLEDHEREAERKRLKKAIKNDCK